MRALYRAVVRPLVTEKSSAAYGARKEYTFVAHPDATKPEIAEAISKLFDVRVLKVRTLVQRSKRKTLGRFVGRTPKWKKAVVQLHDADTIEIFEG